MACRYSVILTYSVCYLLLDGRKGNPILDRETDIKQGPYKIQCKRGGYMEVAKLKPHPNTPKCLDNKVYIGFTLYKDNNVNIPQNTGIFHFVSVDNLNNSTKCRVDTNHAYAYKYFYKRCPEESSGMVASGYCLQAHGRWQYKSATFNSRDGNVNMSSNYVDKSYYFGNDREMHTEEQKMLTRCYNSWKSSGFSLSFTCDVSTIPGDALMASLRVPESHSLVSTAMSDCGCVTCPTSNARSLSWDYWPIWLFLNFLLIYTYNMRTS